MLLFPKLFKSKQLKAERGYSDPKTFVRDDGSEVLHGEDWKQRKEELWHRSEYRCEVRSPLRCQKEAVHPHHLEKRSVYRDDRMENLLAVCAFHHEKFHPEKQPRWGEGSK